MVVCNYVILRLFFKEMQKSTLRFEYDKTQ